MLSVFNKNNKNKFKIAIINNILKNYKNNIYNVWKKKCCYHKSLKI